MAGGLGKGQCWWLELCIFLTELPQALYLGLNGVGEGTQSHFSGFESLLHRGEMTGPGRARRASAHSTGVGAVLMELDWKQPATPQGQREYLGGCRITHKVRLPVALPCVDTPTLVLEGTPHQSDPDTAANPESHHPVEGSRTFGWVVPFLKQNLLQVNIRVGV